MILVLNSSNGRSHTYLLIVKGHFKSLSRINTVPIPILLSTDIFTHYQTEKKIFISETSEFW
jgi:hypothetical protein